MGSAALGGGDVSTEDEVAVTISADVSAFREAMAAACPSAYYSLRAAAAFDIAPERCWRCDARGAETDVGLCTSCHDDLRG
jgi:ferredoxin-like protein FixX